MSFLKKYLSPVGSPASRGVAPVRWTYSTPDALSVILAGGYFNEVRGLLTPGDLIEVQRVDKVPDPNGYGEVWELRVGETAFALDVVVEYTRLVHPGHYVRIPFWINQTDLLAGTAQNLLCPVAGVITRIVTIVKKTITTGGVITASVGTTAVVGVSITHANSDAAGLVVSSAPASGEATAVVDADERIQITPSAAYATAGEVFGFVEIMTKRGNKDYTFFFVNNTDYAAGTNHHLPNVLAGTITKVGTIVQATTTGAQTVTLKADNTTVDGLSITIPTAAAVGSIVTDTPTSGDASTAVDKNSDFELLITSTPSAGSMAGYIEAEITDPPQTPIAKVQFMVGQTDLLAGTSHFMPSPVKGFVKQYNVSIQKTITTGGALGLELDGVDVFGEDGVALVVTVANSATAGTDLQQSVQSSSLTAEVAQYADIEATHASEFATAGAINIVVSVIPTQ